MKVADFHAHIFPDKLADKAAGSIGDFYGVSIARTASVDVLVAEEQKAGVSRCVVSNSAVTPKQVHNINNFISGAITANTNFIGFGSIFPGMDGFEEELDRMLELGLRGVKIHPDFQKLAIDDPSAIETYRAIARRGMPVLFHMGDLRYDHSHPERLARVLDKIPELRVIAAHFGGYSVWDEAVRLLAGSQAYYDTSSSLMFLEPAHVRDLIDALGTDRMLFGTDFPMWKIGEELDRFFALGLSEEDNRKILAGNFLRAFPEMTGV